MLDFLLWWVFTPTLEPILAPNARNEIFGGSPPTRLAELLRRGFGFSEKV